MMKSKKIRVLYISLFSLCVLLTFYVIFKNNDINLILKNISNTDFKFIFVSILCMFAFVSGEGINIRRVLITSGHKVSFFDSFKYACVGFFFSSITPSATGGDPAQLYFMAKDKLPLSLSALSLLVELSSYQAVLCVLSLCGLIVNFNVLMGVSGGVKYFLFLGMIINILYLSFLIMMIFSKNIVIKIINFLFRVLGKFSKKSGEYNEKCLKQLDDYHECAIYLKTHKLVLVKIFMTTVVQMFLYYSVPFFVYRALGLHGENYLSFVFLQASLSMAVSYMPMPGSVGASEGVFMLIYKSIFPASFLTSGMLISRGISFYLFVIITGIFILFSIIYKKICKKSKSNVV